MAVAITMVASFALFCDCCVSFSVFSAAQRSLWEFFSLVANGCFPFDLLAKRKRRHDWLHPFLTSFVPLSVPWDPHLCYLTCTFASGPSGFPLSLSILLSCSPSRITLVFLWHQEPSSQSLPLSQISLSLSLIGFVFQMCWGGRLAP